MLQGVASAYEADYVRFDSLYVVQKAKSGSVLIESGLIQRRLAVTLAIEARKAEVVTRSDRPNGVAPVNRRLGLVDPHGLLLLRRSRDILRRLPRAQGRSPGPDPGASV